MDFVFLLRANEPQHMEMTAVWILFFEVHTAELPAKQSRRSAIKKVKVFSATGVGPLSPGFSSVNTAKL